MVPKTVSVKPYNILIYGAGDHLQDHEETPEENLCGTFLVSLFSNSKPCDVFQLDDNGKTVFWEDVGKERGWCAFYPDTPHRVIPLESGYRAILSFKVFAKGSASPRKEQTSSSRALVDDIAETAEKLKAPLGIILRHHYGYGCKSIYGADRLLLDRLEGKGLLTELKPILICFDGVGRLMDEKGSAKSVVYPLTEECLDIVRRKLEAQNPIKEKYEEDHRPAKRQKVDNEEEILFIHGDKREPNEARLGWFERLWGSDRDGLWKLEVQELAEDESYPHSEHNVYVRYAAIVRPKS
jgi:hypothetical protein